MRKLFRYLEEYACISLLNIMIVCLMVQVIARAIPTPALPLPTSGLYSLLKQAREDTRKAETMVPFLLGLIKGCADGEHMAQKSTCRPRDQADTDNNQDKPYLILILNSP